MFDFHSILIISFLPTVFIYLFVSVFSACDIFSLSRSLIKKYYYCSWHVSYFWDTLSFNIVYVLNVWIHLKFGLKHITRAYLHAVNTTKNMLIEMKITKQNYRVQKYTDTHTYENSPVRKEWKQEKIIY